MAKLTKGEAVQVIGKMVVAVGAALDDEKTPDKITKGELFEILQNGVTDALKEMAD